MLRTAFAWLASSMMLVLPARAASVASTMSMRSAVKALDLAVPLFLLIWTAYTLATGRVGRVTRADSPRKFIFVSVVAVAICAVLLFTQRNALAEVWDNIR